MRIVIAGGPKCGKSTASEALGERLGVMRVRHTDDLIRSHKWSEASAEAATWLDMPGPWIVEGVAAVRALRKWMATASPVAKPCDVVLWLDAPHEELVLGQLSMLSGCETVWREVHPMLRERGVRIVDSAEAIT